MAVRYGDPRNGNNANDATSFANRIKQTGRSRGVRFAGRSGDDDRGG